MRVQNCEGARPDEQVRHVASVGICRILETMWADSWMRLVKKSTGVHTAELTVFDPSRNHTGQ